VLALLQTANAYRFPTVRPAMLPKAAVTYPGAANLAQRQGDLSLGVSRAMENCPLGVTRNCPLLG
jgi:hypothetical protein